MVHRYWPHLKNPLSFSEKVYSRMLYDRSHIWTILSDKLLVRDYIANKIGTVNLIPLLWKGKNPDELPFDDLPAQFVIKTNHGCHFNIIVKDKTKLDQTKTKRQLRKWLCQNYCEDYSLGLSWAYKYIMPYILVEPFFNDNGNVPWDYKFLCFSGRVEFIHIHIDRFRDHYIKCFDRTFKPIDWIYSELKTYPKKVTAPDNYNEMLSVAEAIAEGLDFIRVDLYNTNEKIYVGELACYPAAGRHRFLSRKCDFFIGDKWITN
jgi:hypothetical protein